MTITVYSSSSSLRITLAASVSLILIITTCVPFSRAARSSFKVKGPSRMQSAAPHREAELLVRFRAGVSQRDKETIISTHGGRKKEDLSGESGVEKLELVTGNDAQTVALQMLLDPQVEFAENEDSINDTRDSAVS